VNPVTKTAVRSVENEVEWQNTLARMVAGLAERQSEYPAYTHADLLLDAVDFANGDPLDGALANAVDIPLPPTNLQYPDGRLVPAIDRETGKPREPSRHHEEFIAKHRATFRENLTLAINGALVGERLEVLEREAARMLDPICSYKVLRSPPRGRSVKAGIRYLRAKRVYLRYSLSAILAYIVLNLLDETLDHGHALRKCPLPGCAEPFFFSNTVGRACRPQVYCGPEHLAEGNRLATRARMQKRRRGPKHK
jgi:hypothetical protein